MKNFVLITAIIELLAGLVLFLAPHIAPDLQGEGATALGFGKMYGAAALAIAYFAILVWRNFNSEMARMLFLQVFIVFHIGVAIATLRCYMDGGFEQPAASILHAFLAMITLYFFLKTRGK